MLTTPAGRCAPKMSANVEGRERSLLAGLENDGVARDQRGRDLPDHQQEGIIPRDDADDHAVGFFDSEIDLMMKDGRERRATRVAPDLGVIVETGGDPFHFVAVFAEGFAAFVGHDRGELLLPGAQVASDGVEHLRLFDGGHPAPRVERFAGGLNGAVGVGGGAARERGR